MSVPQMTLGQAIDAMLDGKIVVIGHHRYRSHSNQFWFKPDENNSGNFWAKTDIGSIELYASQLICRLFKEGN